jgi:hypothetical protein
MNETDFTIFWFTAAGFLTMSYALFFWFALRCGMFKDRERARYLPLWAEIPGKLPVDGSQLPVEKEPPERG